jgi:hypothetical protein
LRFVGRQTLRVLVHALGDALVFAAAALDIPPRAVRDDDVVVAQRRREVLEGLVPRLLDEVERRLNTRSRLVDHLAVVGARRVDACGEINQ